MHVFPPGALARAQPSHHNGMGGECQATGIYVGLSEICNLMAWPLLDPHPLGPQGAAQHGFAALVVAACGALLPLSVQNLVSMCSKHGQQLDFWLVGLQTPIVYKWAMPRCMFDCHVRQLGSCNGQSNAPMPPGWCNQACAQGVQNWSSVQN